jgi:uncharacterized membrane protein
VLPPKVRDELPLNRLDGFSDAVLAIAITILVLELRLRAHGDQHLFRAILHEWPSYLAYAASFVTIGVVGLQHARVVRSPRTADAKLYRLNLLVLLFASFLPFPTKIVVDEFVGTWHPHRSAVVFYGLTLLALDLSILAFLRYGAQLHQLATSALGRSAPRQRSGISRATRTTPRRLSWATSSRSRASHSAFRSRSSRC